MEQQVEERSLEEELEEVQTALQSYRSLTKYPEWGVLVKALQEQAEQRTGQVLGALAPQAETKGIDGITMVLSAEFEKGVRSALLMAIDFPRAMVEFCEARRAELRLQIEEGGEE